MKREENSNKLSNFIKLERNGISLITLVITIIVILILAAAIIVTISSNNPISEANKARYENDVASMQAIFTNTVAKIMAQNLGNVKVTAGKINKETSKGKETTGEVLYTITDAVNSNNTSGKIVFDSGTNTDTVYYTGKKLPIYSAGETKWYLDTDGTISLEIKGYKFGKGEIIDLEAVTLMKGGDFKNTIPDIATSLIFTDEVAPSSYTIENGNLIDVSEDGKAGVVAWLDGTTYKVSTQKSGIKAVANVNCNSMFSGKTSLSYIDVSYLDTCKVSNMGYMFNKTGYNATSFKIVGLKNWDTSAVTIMYDMFSYIAYNATECEIESINNWNTSNVIRMDLMFSNALYKAKEVYMDLSDWDTSNVNNMRLMFRNFGFNSTNFNLNLENWNTSNVTNMENMFFCVGYKATSWSIENINSNTVKKYDGSSYTSWDVSNVTNMYSMFYSAGYNAEEFCLDLSNWNTSNVTNMENMFSGTGYSASTWNIGDLSNWNTSNVKTMDSMFREAGYKATKFEIKGINNFDTSNVTDMSYMFFETGKFSNTFNLDLSKWKTFNVKTMRSMFYYAGQDATSWSIGDLSSWDTSNVQDMENMFRLAGYHATSWSIGNIKNWNTSKVSIMTCMFSSAGFKASISSIDLSGWDVSNVTDMKSMFYGWKSVINGQAYARSQADADKFNESLEGSGITSWKFNSVASQIDIIVDNKCSELAIVNIPEIVEANVTRIELLAVEDGKDVISFKLNGKLMEGNTFLTSSTNETVIISDVIIGKVIESQHYPYEKTEIEIFGDVTFEGATSLKVDLLYKMVNDTSWDYIYIYDKDGVQYGKYGGTTETKKTILIPGNYLSLKFTSLNGRNYEYGFKAVITPIYE